MINLNYTYISSGEIFQDIVFIKDFEILWYAIIIFLIILCIIFIMYIMPVFYSIKESYKTQKEKDSKKLLLKQIIMQKELEDEILKEIKKY